MQRKSTLAYGTTGTTARTSPAQVSRRRRLDSRPTSEAPPRSTPSSMPPSGLRLVQPAAVPRPKMSSIPPEPTSIRALMPRVALPRPAALPRIVAPRLEDEVEALDDADLTIVEDEAAPAALTTRAPLPPVPWTPETTPIPANRTVPTTPPPRPVAPVAEVVAAEVVAAEVVTVEVVAAAAVAAEVVAPEPAVAAAAVTEAPRWIAPAATVAPTVEDDEAFPPLSPIAALRARALEAWTGTSPRVRTALTFAAGFVAGGVAVAVL